MGVSFYDAINWMIDGESGEKHTLRGIRMQKSDGRDAKGMVLSEKGIHAKTGGIRMTNMIAKYKNEIVASFVLVLLLLLMGGCGHNPDIMPMQSAQPTPSAGTETPEGILLPFDEKGYLVWGDLENNHALVGFDVTRIEYVAGLSDPQNAHRFIELMNGISVELLGGVEEAGDINDTCFAEYNLDYAAYTVTIDSDDMYDFMAVYQKGNCGYLQFRMKMMSDMNTQCHSLYKISLDSFYQLAAFFESLEKIYRGGIGKPVLYLYPQTALDVAVELAFEGQLSITYPAYDGGWNVRAYPNGHLINHADGLEYSYLFWEGQSEHAWWNLEEGYCVAGADTAVFLQKTLGELGLTPKEYNEFIVYWLPQMQDNPYNLIAFQWEEYERIAPLTIKPAPDSMLRVFMVFVPLESPVDIKTPPERPAFSRDGFTVVEWGASRIEYGE